MTRFALDEYLLHCCLMKLAINYYQYLLVVLEFASLVDFGLASPSTVPAFLWSPHLQYANGETDVNYQVMSAKDLVDSVFTLGGWSNFLCSEKKLQQPVDVALVFIGRELLSSDVSSNQNSDPVLVNTLKYL
ncbi:2-C-methyl-D-erythritol 4-phosphate cytidylyltransferase [Arabidopsis thaliana]|uniref:2-C-methyl-D-erythritol 4-phosphate cytidylyltransferase n=3 Tax=Arabidopsis TaxID=3701 RepID=F4I1T8_ARATH|nr:2-C-methyl-D-erythritol 4-phosphate cytidylyltransferase [Arabidopsis thaliana]AEE33264.1 2-C-methyl-D-erythritol 4-phosphate cytidylyltransferase [Arabidopsis thaliana]|eukprot:NP_001117500.1 2-C-methyl-D-erythritol 4-phosphate cytidylyltransferase [Arabidopsis thaliana]